MSFTTKDWRNKTEDGTRTYLSAEAMEDLEERLSGYTDDTLNGAVEGSAINGAADATITGLWTFSGPGGASADALLEIRGEDRGNGTDYLTQFGVDGVNPGILTNGWVSIVGQANAGTDNGDPFDSSDVTISGNTAYMLGISSDVTTSPVIVVKGSTGPYMNIYDESDNLTFQIKRYGSTVISPQGVAAPPLKVKQSAASDQTLLVVGSNAGHYVGIGVSRTDSANEITLGVVGSAGNYFSGSAAGDAALKLSDSSKTIHIGVAGSAATIKVQDAELGFFGTTPQAKPTVTGSKGSNAALTSLLTALAGYGLITDSSS